MWALVYTKDYGIKNAGDLHAISRGSFSLSHYNSDVVVPVEIPDQDVSQLYVGEPLELGGTIADLVQYTEEEKANLIDRNTGIAITKRIHPVAGTDEQLGVLRDQLVQWGNTLGLNFTNDFTRLNELAIAEIEKAQIEKEAL